MQIVVHLVKSRHGGFIPILLFIFCFGIASPLKSQFKNALNFHAIDNTNGLPNNYINALEMDSLGFLWIATNDGLCRYDSPSNIKVYKSGQLGLESNLIKSLHAGNDSILWIGSSFGGLTKLNILNHHSKTYNSQKNEDQALSNNEVLSIFEMDTGEVWVGTENGLNVLNPKSDSIYQFGIDAGSDKMIRAKAILNITQDSRGWIWIGTWNGSLYLYLPSPSGKHSEGIFRQFVLSDHVGSKHIWKILQESDSRFWIATHSGGLFRMELPENASNKQTEQDWEPTIYRFSHDLNVPYSISSDYVQDVNKDSNDNIWIASIHGLNILSTDEIDKFENSIEKDPVSVQFYKQYHDAMLKNTLTNNNLTRVFRDKQGLMWLGSVSGINQYNWYTNQFNLYNIPNQKKSSNEKHELINSIYVKDSSIVLLGSESSGILHYDIQQQEVVKKKPYKIPQFNKRVTTFHKGHGDDLYVGTIKGIGRLNLKTQASKMYYYPKAEINENVDNFMSCIFKDRQGRLWGGTEFGLILVGEEEESYTWFIHDHLDPRSISDNAITQMYEDTKGNFWVTTFNGLNLLKEDDEGIYFESFKRDDPGIGERIPSNQITAISEYKGKLYFGSRGGIFHYDLNTKSFAILNEQRIQYTINSIQITNAGILWASTTDGVLCLDLQSYESKLYDRNDGLGNISFRVSSGSMDEASNLYFGGNKGFVKINDFNLKRNVSPPKVYVTDINTINSNSSKKFIGINHRSISLPSDNYYVSLNFAALNYNQPENNEYAYRLEGFENDDWQFTRSQQVDYTNLEAGEYTFHVKASNNEGVWNDEGSHLHIHVKHAFVETIWFKLLIAALTIGLFWIGNLVYTRNIRKRNEILKEYNERLNDQVNETNAAKESLEEREKHMKILLEKLDQSNQELLRSNKDLEQFAYVASHDMKEPLRTVGTFTNLLDRKFGKQLEASGKEYMDFIIEGVERMSALINSLLTYSQVGKKDVEFKRNNLTWIVKSKIKDLSKIIDDKNAKIICNDLPIVYCAGDQIGMVFYNLILNGIKFNKSDQPHIKISHTENEKYWTFIIEDNGIGIQKEYQDQIFEIFKRLHSREEYEGTGIGLALCNKIILRHNGEISVTSEESEGTTFHFTIDKHITPDIDKSTQRKNISLGNEVKEILRA